MEGPVGKSFLKLIVPVDNGVGTAGLYMHCVTAMVHETSFTFVAATITETEIFCCHAGVAGDNIYYLTEGWLMGIVE